MRAGWIVVVACATCAAQSPPPALRPAPAGAGEPLALAEPHWSRDTDRDGVPDTFDPCPYAAESRNGIEDQDGCPEPDRDKDRIVDAKDRCPDEPETYNGVEDTDGCPDKGPVVVFRHHVGIPERIHFAPGSATLAGEALGLLSEVAAVLKGNPELAAIEVQGHADAREAHPFDLGLARVRSVCDHLVAQGIAKERLVERSYGASRPEGVPPAPTGAPGAAQKAGISPTSDRDQTAKNRRVEFLLLPRRD